MAKCKICDEPVCTEDMSKENQQHLINILGEGIIKVMSKVCMRCLILSRELNECNLKQLTYFGKRIDLLIKEKGK